MDFLPIDLGVIVTMCCPLSCTWHHTKVFALGHDSLGSFPLVLWLTNPTASSVSSEDTVDVTYVLPFAVRNSSAAAA
eukprot:10134393-Ditylum_brightwellii.AAC.1